MAGVYWISNAIIFNCICNIPHRTLCNNCNTVVFFPGTRKRNRQEIFLAPNDWRNCCRNTGDWINQYILRKTVEIRRFLSRGRSDGIRTHDLYVPNVALYQAELHSANNCCAIMSPFNKKINP